MNKYKVVGLTGRVPAGSIVVLNADQAKRRRHLIQTSEDAPEDTYTALDVLVFKQGEVFSSDAKLTKQQGDSIVMLDEEGNEKPDDDAEYDEMTVAELKEACEGRDIKVVANMRRDEIIELLVAADAASGESNSDE